MAVASELEFLQLYETYQPRIVRYLAGLVGPDEAEDLSQQVFLRAGQNLAGFRGEAQVSTWLYRIASNAAIDRIRSASYRHGADEIQLDTMADEDQIGVETKDIRSPVEASLYQKDRLQCFLGYVDRLPFNYRVVVLLNEVEELSTREIAQVLGVSHETVKIRLHRGRARLFQALRETCHVQEWL